MPTCVNPDGCTSYCTKRCAGDEPEPRAPRTETIVETSIALVRARDEVRRLAKARAAFLCERERIEDPEGEDRREVDPCWRATYEKPDPECGGGGWLLAVEPEDWCEPCQQRQVVFLQLRAARRRVVSLTSGLFNATRAHMRREGLMAPATLTPPSPSPCRSTSATAPTRGDGEDRKADGASPFQQQEQE